MRITRVGTEIMKTLYKDRVDKWLLFFNGDDTFERVADNDEIYDNELLELFFEGVEHE